MPNKTQTQNNSLLSDRRSGQHNDCGLQWVSNCLCDNIGSGQAVQAILDNINLECETTAGVLLLLLTDPPLGKTDK